MKNKDKLIIVLVFSCLMLVSCKKKHSRHLESSSVTYETPMGYSNKFNPDKIYHSNFVTDSIAYTAIHDFDIIKEISNNHDVGECRSWDPINQEFDGGEKITSLKLHNIYVKDENFEFQNTTNAFPNDLESLSLELRYLGGSFNHNLVLAKYDFKSADSLHPKDTYILEPIELNETELYDFLRALNFSSSDYYFEIIGQYKNYAIIERDISVRMSISYTLEYNGPKRYYTGNNF